MSSNLVFLLVIFLLLGSVSAQTAPKLPAQTPVIDGKLTPNLIPDHVAYRMVLLSFSVPQNPTPTDLRRQAAHFNALGQLSPVEASAAREILQTFRAQYDLAQSRQKYDKTTNHRAIKKNLVQGALQQLSKALTAGHMDAFTQYVQTRKGLMATTEVQ